MRPLLVAAVALTLAASCAAAPEVHRPYVGRPPSRPAAPARQAPVPGAQAALSTLATLRVVARSSASPYRRVRFGQAWADVDHNGCDTRNDVLARDLTAVRRRGRCVVVAGTLQDPYTGRDEVFAKAHADQVQIDHVVALGNAWASGASTWSDARRLAFANDPGELLAVDGATNEAKGDQDASTWLPPVGQCAYAARQVAVKAQWALSATRIEHDALVRVLTGCAGGVAPAAVTDPDYGSCRAAEAHGKGPYRRGVDPEYRFYDDGDGDGVVCE